MSRYALWRRLAGWACVAALSACSGEGASAAANAGSSPPASATPASAASQAGGTPPSSGRSGVGLNLGGLDYYSPGFPTIDLMKKGSPWLTQCSPYKSASCRDFTAPANDWDTREQDKLQLDTEGWIKSLPAADDATVKFRYATTILLNGGWQPAGHYIVRYDGKGSLSYSGVGTRVASESRDGRDVVLVKNKDPAGLFLSVVATDPKNPLRNIRVYPPGGACGETLDVFAADESACGGNKGRYTPFERFPAEAIWHPAFLQDLRGFRTLRFLDWTRSLITPTAMWADRAAPSARSWNGPAGAPVEFAVALGNRVGADPWLNLPPKADDDYIRQWARTVRQALAPDRTLFVEYGNEPWNYAFQPTHWMLEQAKAAWPDLVAQGKNVYELQINWYARRLVQACQIVKAEFKEDAGRVRCVANAQAANAWNTRVMLECGVAARALQAPCARSIDAVAVAPYFGHYISEPKQRASLAGWLAQPDGGVTKLFDDLLGVSPPQPDLIMAKESGGQGLKVSRQWMQATRAVLAPFGLPMLAYEGGQHLVPAGNESDPRVSALFIAANRDARMADVYRRHLDDWRDAGGETFVYYSHLGRFSKFGMWGLKETPDDNTAPKWTAATRERDTVKCWWPSC